MSETCRWGSITLILVGVFGCGESGPQEASSVAERSNQVADVVKTRIHIDGFKKSKSGAT